MNIKKHLLNGIGLFFAFGVIAMLDEKDFGEAMLSLFISIICFYYGDKNEKEDLQHKEQKNLENIQKYDKLCTVKLRIDKNV